MLDLTKDQWRVLGLLYNASPVVDAKTVAESRVVLEELARLGLASLGDSQWEITGDGRGIVDAELRLVQEEIRAGLSGLMGSVRMSQDQEAQTLGRVVEEALREFLPDAGFFDVDKTAVPASYIEVVPDTQEPGDEEAGILRMKLKLDPNAPDHVRESFRRMVEGPTEEELEDSEGLDHLAED